MMFKHTIPLVVILTISCLSLQSCKTNAGNRYLLNTVKVACTQESISPQCIADNAQLVLAGIDDPFDWATSAAELAIANDSLSNTEAVSSLLNEALSKADDIEDKKKRATAYGDIALALSKIQPTSAMMPLVEQLTERAKQAGSDDKKWDILGKLATARAVHGDRAGALKMALTMPSATYSQDAFKGRTQREISKKYAEAGDFKTAIEIINEIDADFTYYSAVARTDIAALAIEAGQPNLVERLFEEALSIAKKQDNGYFSGAILRDIGYSQVKMGETNKAKVMFANALELARGAKSDQEKARAISRIATRMADCGLTDQSAEILLEALSISGRIESETFANFALYEIAGSASFSAEFDLSRSLITEIPETQFGSAVSLKAAAQRDLAWGLARYGQVNEAMSIANSITSPREKVHTLSRLVRLLKTPAMNALPRYL
ncbi:MAG: hypothetical protein ACSHXY_05930 [Alphaproteobacteria bacterium]